MTNIWLLFLGLALMVAGAILSSSSDCDLNHRIMIGNTLILAGCNRGAEHAEPSH